MAQSTLSTFNSSLATDPLRSFRFTASFVVPDPFDPRIKDSNSTNLPSAGKSIGWVGGFSSISGLSINTQNIPYREGGYNTTVHQIPGMTTFQPITFSRGVLYGNDQAMAWMRGIFGAASGEGLYGTSSSNNFRVDIILNVNRHPADPVNDTPQIAFKIHNAWITALNYTDLDASNGSILFETIQVVHEGISVAFTDATGKSTDSAVTVN